MYTKWLRKLEIKVAPSLHDYAIEIEGQTTFLQAQLYSE